MQTRLLLIVVALLIALPALLFAGWHMLPPAEMAGQCTSLPPIVPDEAGAVAFSRKLRSAILDNPAGPFELHTTDVELTSYVALNTQGRQLADPQIHFLDNTVCLSGRLVGLGLIRPRFLVEVHPRIVGGNIQLEIRYFIVNGQMLPAWLRRLAQRITNESIQDASLPLRTDTIQVSDGEIAISGQRLLKIGD